MKTSVKAGWVVFILVSTIIFSLCAAGSHNWDTHRVLVQESVYEDVPSSQTRINAYWVGSIASSILIGIVLGLIVFFNLDTRGKEV